MGLNEITPKDSHGLGSVIADNLCKSYSPQILKITSLLSNYISHPSPAKLMQLNRLIDAAEDSRVQKAYQLAKTILGSVQLMHSAGPTSLSGVGSSSVELLP